MTNAALLQLLVDEVRRLAAVIERLELRIGGLPRDGADVRVLQALVEMGLVKFTSQEVWALQTADLALQQALSAALVDTPEHVGKCMARLYQRRLIDRDPTRGRHGWSWWVV